MNKRIVAFMLLALLLVSLVFLAGCQKKEQQAAAPAAAASGAPTEITWYRWEPNYPSITHFSESLWFQELQKRTNMKITVQGPFAPGGGNIYNEAATVVLASGDMPDLFLYDWTLYNGGIEGAVKDGLVFNFGKNPEYLKMVPNFTKILESDPNMMRDITLMDGSIPRFAMINEKYEVCGYFGTAIRLDWLDRVGKKMPTTIDEFHDVLTAFKTKDANGNGDPNDEIPFTDTTSYFALQNIMSAYTLRYNIFYPDPSKPGQNTYWAIYNDGKNFTQFLTDMAQWYKEGLLDPDMFAQADEQRNAKVVNDKAGMAQAWPANYITWRDAIKGTVASYADPNGVHFGCVPRLKGIDGKPYFAWDAMIRLGQVTESTTIAPATEKAGKVPAILNMVNYMYSQEGQELVSYGVENVSFTRAADGTRQFMDVIMKDPEMAWTDKVLLYACPYWGSWPKVMLYDAWKLTDASDPDQLAAHLEMCKGDMSILAPNVQMEQDQMEQFNPILNDLNTATTEFMSRVITGQRPLSDIPAFLQQLESMGVRKALQIYQTAYDAYMSK